MTKQEILDTFSDIDFAYNDSSKHETLSRMLDELLKEQEAMMQCIKGKCRICPHCANCDVDENGLLKEQEAEWIEFPECLAYDGAYSDSHIVCSACKHVFSIMDNCTEEFDYCPHCGAKMKQEGR